MTAVKVLAFFLGLAAAVIVTGWLNNYMWWVFAAAAGIAAWVLVYEILVRWLAPKV